ncbi:DUF6318 family protein [Cellulomonas sp. URHB0016]
MWIRRGPLLWTAVGVVALTVAGCTGGPATEGTTSAAAAPTVSSTRSPSTSPTAPAPTAPPERPSAMSAPSADGAAAAAAYFAADLYEYTYATGDVSGWTALSGPECTFCTGVSDDVARMSSLGHRASDFSVTVASATGTEVYPGQSYSADVKITQSPSEEIDNLGSVVSSSEGGSYSLLFALGWDNQWVVREVDVHRDDEAADG